MKELDLKQYRYFLKDSVRKRINFANTDQNRQLPPPPLEKPFAEDAERIDLNPVDACKSIPHIDLQAAISQRASRRDFLSDEMTLEELSFLLWATQSIRGIVSDDTALRIVPSAGSRHSFETYLFIRNINGLEKGLYRYLPMENQLLVLGEIENMESALARACFGQTFVSTGAVTFVWTTIPYRMEWRYSFAAHRAILIDAGHVCQNLYLACEAIHAGTCAVAAYDQEALDELLGVDGTDEFAMYLAPVGKV